MEQVSKSGKVPNPKKAMYIIDPPTEPAAVEATSAAYTIPHGKIPFTNPIKASDEKVGLNKYLPNDE